MRSLYDFIVEPIGQRYNNTKQIGDKELIVNTEIFNHQYVNRQAKVLALPILIKTNIQVGDTVVVHHNVFRRWHNIRGEEKNSTSFVKENMYAISLDQIYLYKHSKTWITPPKYCFVKPIKSIDKFSSDTEQPLMGIMRYNDNDIQGVNIGDLVGFTPDNEYEFIIDGERLYRVLINDISIKYEYQGQEEEYNPSWLQSG